VHLGDSALFNITSSCAHHPNPAHHENPPERAKVRVLHPKIGLFWCCWFVIKIAGLVLADLAAETAIFSRIAMIFSPPAAWQVPVLLAVWTLSVTALA